MYPVQEKLQVLLYHNPRVKQEDFSQMYSYTYSNYTHLKQPLQGQVVIMALCNEFEAFLSQKIIPQLKGSHTPRVNTSQTTWIGTVMEHSM
jgi:hypothetical protein